MGCILSKKNRPKRNPPLKEISEKLSSSRINSSRIDDSSQQTKDELQVRSNFRETTKVKLIESEDFSSSRFSEKHPEISEIGDTDEDENENPPDELKIEATRNVIHHSFEKEESELKQQVAAGWPAWLVSVAGEALVDWVPRRASTFEKLEKIGQGTYSSVYKARVYVDGSVQCGFLWNWEFCKYSKF